MFFKLPIRPMNPIKPIFQRPELTILNTVAAHHTACGINGMGLIVDTSSLAIPRTHRAVLAFLRIEMNLQEGETTDERQESTYGTNRIAISSSVTPSKEEQDDEGNGSNY